MRAIRKPLAIVTCIVALAATASAHAVDEGPYGEIGYTGMEAYASGGETVRLGVLRGLLGLPLARNLAIEGLIGIGVADDPTCHCGGTGSADIDRMFGLYARPSLQLTPSVELYGRFGYAHSKTAVAWRGTRAYETDGDRSWGLGIRYRVGRATSVNLDYMNYHGKDDITIQGLNAGIAFRF